MNLEMLFRNPVVIIKESDRWTVAATEAYCIRQLYATGSYSQRRLGKMFNLSHVQIGRIVKGQQRCGQRI